MALTVGAAIARLRDAIARRLVALGATPDALTWTGAGLALAVGACLAVGAGHAAPWEPGLGHASAWPLAAAAFMLLAGAMDVLDGAVARVGGRASRYGAFLDSSLDRLGDLLPFLGCAVHFAVIGNATMVALAFAAAMHAQLISYVKARAENFVPGCGVGYWQRGERYVYLLCAAALGRVPSILWVLGTLPAFTVLARLRHAGALLRDRPPPPDRFRRGRPAYDVACAVQGVAAFVAPWIHPWFAGNGDPLGALLRAL